jgi:hypothetical protein
MLSDLADKQNIPQISVQSYSQTLRRLSSHWFLITLRSLAQFVSKVSDIEFRNEIEPYRSLRRSGRIRSGSAGQACKESLSIPMYVARRLVEDGNAD